MAGVLYNYIDPENHASMGPMRLRQTGEREHPHAARPAGQQDPAAFGRRGTRREHIIDKEHVPTRHGFRTREDKRSAHISTPLSARELGLGSGGDGSPER